MTYKEKKRSMFLGLPWTFTTYTVTDEFISIDSGLLNKVENDCYMYKVIDVRLETTLMERILGIGTIHCFTGDVTDPDLKLQHIKNAKEIKDFILKQSEQERLKRKTLNMQHLDGNPEVSRMAATDSCKSKIKLTEVIAHNGKSPLFYINFPDIFIFLKSLAEVLVII